MATHPTGPRDKEARDYSGAEGEHPGGGNGGRGSAVLSKLALLSLAIDDWATKPDERARVLQNTRLMAAQIPTLRAVFFELKP